MTFSAVVLSLGLMCLWPLFVGFVGFNIGRKRLRIQSPIVIRRGTDEYSESEPQIKQSPFKRISR